MDGSWQGLQCSVHMALRSKWNLVSIRSPCYPVAHCYPSQTILLCLMPLPLPVGFWRLSGATTAPVSAHVIGAYSECLLIVFEWTGPECVHSRSFCRSSSPMVRELTKMRISGAPDSGNPLQRNSSNDPVQHLIYCMTAWRASLFTNKRDSQRSFSKCCCATFEKLYRAPLNYPSHISVRQ